MDDKVDLDSLTDTIFAVLMVLYSKGLTDIHCGGLLRIVGVPNEVAAEFDDQIVSISPVELTSVDSIENCNPGSTVH